MAETLVATPDEDGHDQSYIDQGVQDAERMLRERDLAVGVGEFVIQPVAFAVGALGFSQNSRRQRIGIDKGGFVLNKRALVGYTPARASHVSSLN